jgi:hypothetical protein
VSETSQRVEAAWLAQSTEEEFYFAMFQEPALLRRSTLVTGALAKLRFGGYTSIDGEWLDDDRVVWLDMITSDVPGHGGQLLDALGRVLGQAGLALVGTPTPLKPRDWSRERPIHSRMEPLLCWYIRHGFRVVQNGSETRVILTPLASMLTSTFSFV